MAPNSPVTSGLTTESQPVQPRLIRRSAEHQGVSFHQWNHGVVAAADHGGYGNPTAEAGIKNQMIPLQKP